MESYVPIFLQLLAAAAVAAGMLGLAHWLGRPRGARHRIDTSPYECGSEPVGTARGRFSVHFYLVAMLFILFDIEVAFLIPWAVTFKSFADTSRIFVMTEMAVFLGILIVGFAYLWKRGALEWD